MQSARNFRGSNRANIYLLCQKCMKLIKYARMLPLECYLRDTPLDANLQKLVLLSTGITPEKRPDKLKVVVNSKLKLEHRTQFH